MTDDLETIWLADKVLSVDPDWKSRPSDEFVRLVAPLEINGVTVEGLRFTASAHAPTPDRWMTFQIEVASIKNPRGSPIVRFEWRPRSPHNNKGIGPPEYQHRPIHGTHIHPFDLNWKHSASHLRKGNLPIALPVSDRIETYEAALAFVEDCFRIKGVSALPPPPWTARIL